MTRLAVLVTALAAGACGPSAETVEARRVIAAIDALRDAPGSALSDRARKLEGLEREPADAPAAARARDACAAAYRPLLEGQELEARVRAKLADPASLDGGVLADLARAEASIVKSRELMPPCEQAAAELRRKLR